MRACDMFGWQLWVWTEVWEQDGTGVFEVNMGVARFTRGAIPEIVRGLI